MEGEWGNKLSFGFPYSLGLHVSILTLSLNIVQWINTTTQDVECLAYYVLKHFL